MKEPLEPALARLDQLAKRLNEQTKQINQQIVSLNERLAQMNIGASVWDEDARHEPVVLDNTSGETLLSVGSQLGYAKVKGVWQLAIRTVSVKVRFFEGDEDQPWYDTTVHGEPQPLLEGPRIVRVQACGRFKYLIEALTRRLEGFLEGIGESPTSGHER